MSFHDSNQPVPAEHQWQLYVRRENDTLIIAGETELSKNYGFAVGQSIGEVPKNTPIYEID